MSTTVTEDKLLTKRGGITAVTVIVTEHFTCSECSQPVWQQGHSTAPLCPICHHLAKMSPEDQKELCNYLGRPLKPEQFHANNRTRS